MDSIQLEVVNSWDIYLRDHTYNPSFLHNTTEYCSINGIKKCDIQYINVKCPTSLLDKKQIRMLLDGFRFPGKNKPTKK